ncbi:MAG: outer membrane beta-barrel protein [Bacteroidota bacterium]
MVTRSVLIFFFVLLSIILAPLYSGVAQNLEGRWVLGFHGGGNVWINDYNTALVGSGGEVMLRYGISPVFSAGILVGYEELKSKEVPQAPPFQEYLKLHAIPASADVWVHFCPGEQVNPYIYAGVGYMIYKRLNGDGVYIPNSEYKSSIDMPFGIGIEVFPSKDVSIIADGGYRVTDDYPDALKIGKIDGYATAKVGVNVYLGTSDADAEAQRLKEAEARRVEDLANAEARRVKQQADADAEAKRVKMPSQRRSV